MCDHGPTHIDPICHFSRDPNAESVDEIPLAKCITSAICLDMSDVPVQTQFGPEKIQAELDRWKLDIRPGAPFCSTPATMKNITVNRNIRPTAGFDEGSDRIHNRKGMHQFRCG